MRKERQRKSGVVKQCGFQAECPTSLLCSVSSPCRVVQRAVSARLGSHGRRLLQHPAQGPRLRVDVRRAQHVSQLRRRHRRHPERARLRGGAQHRQEALPRRTFTRASSVGGWNEGGNSTFDFVKGTRPFGLFFFLVFLNQRVLSGSQIVQPKKEARSTTHSV